MAVVSVVSRELVPDSCHSCVIGSMSIHLYYFSNYYLSQIFGLIHVYMHLSLHTFKPVEMCDYALKMNFKHV